MSAALEKIEDRALSSDAGVLASVDALIAAAQGRAWPDFVGRPDLVVLRRVVLDQHRYAVNVARRLALRTPIAKAAR